MALPGVKRASNSKRTPRRGRGPKAEPYVVFISHSSRDAWIAGIMVEKVTGLGAKVWLDVKDLQGGDIVDQEILKGIDSCQEAIVLVSPESAGSQWVIFEIGATWGQHKRVTPVLNNVPYDAIAPLRVAKAIDLKDFDRFLSELGSRIGLWKDAKE